MTTPNAIQLASTEELLIEIASRYDYVVFSGRKLYLKNGQGIVDTKRFHNGDYHCLLGMCCDLQDKIQKQLDKNNLSENGTNI